MHTITFRRGDIVQEILAKNPTPQTMLTKFFHTNSTDPQARRHLYREFPKYTHGEMSFGITSGLLIRWLEESILFPRLI